MRKWKIRHKAYVFIILTILLSTMSIILVSYFINKHQIDDIYKQTATDNAKNFADSVDGDFIKQLDEIIPSEEYQAIREKAEEEENEQLVIDYLSDKGLYTSFIELQTNIDNYIENIHDIKYLYILKPKINDKYDMFLCDDSSNPIYNTAGGLEYIEEEFIGIDIAYLKEPVISNGDWGWLCSSYSPIYDSNHNIVAVVGCDIDMEDVIAQRKLLLIKLSILAILATIIIFHLAVLAINKGFVSPIENLILEMKKFTPNLDYHKANLIHLDIRNDDEIKTLYDEIYDMQTNITTYLCDILSLQENIEHKNTIISEISKDAYKDPLTNVGSKSAYSRKIVNLTNQINNEHLTEVGLIMIDVNNLKYINDTYGHSNGDIYLKGCCENICKVFDANNVFRIGGDEFIVILLDNEFKNRYELLNLLRAEFNKSYNNMNTELWKRFSASIGMAEYSNETDTLDLMFKKADKYMYMEKMKFKKTNVI